MRAHLGGDLMRPPRIAEEPPDLNEMGAQRSHPKGLQYRSLRWAIGHPLRRVALGRTVSRGKRALYVGSGEGPISGLRRDIAEHRPQGVPPHARMQERRIEVHLIAMAPAVSVNVEHSRAAQVADQPPYRALS